MQENRSCEKKCCKFCCIMKKVTVVVAKLAVVAALVLMAINEFFPQLHLYRTYLITSYARRILPFLMGAALVRFIFVGLGSCPCKDSCCKDKKNQCDC